MAFPVYVRRLALISLILHSAGASAALKSCADVVLDPKSAATEPFYASAHPHNGEGTIDRKRLQWRITPRENAGYAEFFQRLFTAEATVANAQAAAASVSTKVASDAADASQWAESAEVGKSSRRPKSDKPWQWLQVSVRKTGAGELLVALERYDDREFSEELATYFSRQVGLPAAPPPRTVESTRTESYAWLEAQLLEVALAHVPSTEGIDASFRTKFRERLRESLRDQVILKLMRGSFLSGQSPALVPNDLNSLIARFDSSRKPLDLVDEGGVYPIKPAPEEFDRWLKENAPAPMYAELKRRWDTFRNHPSPHAGYVDWLVTVKPVENIQIELTLRLVYRAEIDALGNVAVKECHLGRVREQTPTTVTATVSPVLRGVASPRNDVIVSHAQLLATLFGPDLPAAPSDAGPGVDPLEPLDDDWRFFSGAESTNRTAPAFPRDSDEDLDLSTFGTNFAGVRTYPSDAEWAAQEEDLAYNPLSPGVLASSASGASGAAASSLKSLVSPVRPPPRLLTEEDLKPLADKVISYATQLKALDAAELAEFKTLIYAWIKTSEPLELRISELHAVLAVTQDATAGVIALARNSAALQSSIGNQAVIRMLQNYNVKIVFALMTMAKHLGNARVAATVSIDRLKSDVRTLTSSARYTRAPGIEAVRPLPVRHISSPPVETRVLKPPRMRTR